MRWNVANTPDWIRTSNLRFRRPMLYPVELRVRRLRARSPSVATYRNPAAIGRQDDGQLIDCNAGVVCA